VIDRQELGLNCVQILIFEPKSEPKRELIFKLIILFKFLRESLPEIVQIFLPLNQHVELTTQI